VLYTWLVSHDIRSRVVEGWRPVLLLILGPSIYSSIHDTVMSQSTTSLFRRLAWQSSVTLEIRFAEDGPGGGGVPEVYYVSREQRATASRESE
jgi:hypothetical protein